MNSIFQFLSTTGISAFLLWLKIMKLMVPISILVKVAEILGIIKLIGNLLEPVMLLVGLPGVLGLVWAITLMTNLWAGALMFIALSGLFHLSTAQVTILGILMLMAHGLPIELRVAQKCGVGIIFSFCLRMSSALILAISFDQIFTYFNLLQTPAEILFSINNEHSNSLYAWALQQLESYIFVLLMLFTLVLILDFLKHFGLIQILGKILAPYLSLIGVSKSCAPITLVGTTLGLVYGSALLLKELKNGELDKKDILLSITSMNLFHSIIEDTIIVILMGAALFWVLVVRFIFSILIMRSLIFFLRIRPKQSIKILSF